MNQEYCILFLKSDLTCMNKSEWAAWVQVLGVLLTVLYTYFAARKEHNAAKDKELWLAGLDASTIYAEYAAAFSIMEGVHGKLFRLLRNKESVYADALSGVLKDIQVLNTRPLREQERLVPVGRKYLAGAAEFQLRVASLKNSSNDWLVYLSHDRDLGFDEIQKSIDEIEKMQRLCNDLTKELSVFAKSRGIVLPQGQPMVSLLARLFYEKNGLNN